MLKGSVGSLIGTALYQLMWENVARDGISFNEMYACSQAARLDVGALTVPVMRFGWLAGTIQRAKYLRSPLQRWNYSLTDGVSVGGISGVTNGDLHITIGVCNSGYKCIILLLHVDVEGTSSAPMREPQFVNPPSVVPGSQPPRPLSTKLFPDTQAAPAVITQSLESTAWTGHVVNSKCMVSTGQSVSLTAL